MGRRFLLGQADWPRPQGSCADLVAQTRQAIDQALGVGFRKDMVAVVSIRGREGSALGAFDQLGGHRLRKFAGGYDAGGSPVYSEGEVLLESVCRFKGRSAPCVILTEIDFEALGENEMRKIFVGATRATMKPFLVMSEGAAARSRASVPVPGDPHSRAIMPA